ncbi:COG4695 Phage-related protein [uncultured Caudovirales phage]|uniref:COG4695 Phage-related protein n=1 Tax=uncultured Caudovirales phage TaxID=2100421 RepID=A0A6J5QUP1_9CAUD|nr:COG4695 Phage-related protein [uncultured Caudovirales phage]
MNWKFWETKESAVARSLVTLGLGSAGWSANTGISLARNGYMLNPDAYACVSLIASNIRQIDPLLYREGRDEHIDLPDSHPAYRLLARPNERQDWAAFVEAIASNLLIYGNAYIEAASDTRGAPRFLYALRPDRMTINSTRSGEVADYDYQGPIARITLPAESVGHIRFFHPDDDWYGFSPMAAAMAVIDQENDAHELNKRVLKNQGRPSGGLFTERSLTDDQFNRLKGEALEAFTGRNYGKPGLFEGGFKWQEMGLSPSALGMWDGLRVHKRTIASIFHVPPELIGDTDSKTFSNFREARKGLYTEAVIPLLTLITGFLNHWLMPRFGAGISIGFDKDRVDALAEDRESAWRRTENLYVAGVISREEARAELGFDAGAGGTYITDATVAKSDEEIIWKSFDDRRRRFEIQARRVIEDAFGRERELVIAAAKNGNIAAIDQAVKDNAQAWADAYAGIVRRVASDFATETTNDLKAQGGRFDTKAVSDVWLAAVLQWVRDTTAEKVEGIGDTTRELLKTDISRALLEGASTFNLQRIIAASYASFTDYRAERIARTEVVAASNLGSVAAAQATGLTLRKKWLATPDPRIRDSHRAVNGQTRDLKEAFSVAGSRLMFPGDSSMGAAAAQVINCRCTQTYEVVE